MASAISGLDGDRTRPIAAIASRSTGPQSAGMKWLRLMAGSAALLPAAIAAQALAQHMNAKDAPCRDAVITSEAAECFSRAARAQDQALTALLGRVRPATGGDELKLLNRAQAAWVQYRQLSCDGEYAMYEGGTAAPVARLACLEALTRERIKQLHAAYNWRVEKHEWTVPHPNGR